MEAKNCTKDVGCTSDKECYTYEENGSVFIVHREFDSNGGTMLGQVVSLLLDMMEQQNQEK